MPSPLSESEQDKIILDNMSVVDFWTKALGADLQQSDRDDLQGTLYLKLVLSARNGSLNGVDNVRNFLSVRLRMAGYRWLSQLRNLPATNYTVDVPDELKDIPQTDVDDFILSSCQNEQQEQVVHLLLAGLPLNEIAGISGLSPQRISELKQGILARVRRKNNRLEGTATVRRSASRTSREVHGTGGCV